MSAQVGKVTIHFDAGEYAGMKGPHGGAVRPPLMGQRGVVSSGNWFASQEALRVYQDGGNAFDAAVVAAAVVAVTEPCMSGVAGTGSAVCYHARSKTTKALDFQGYAPKAAGNGGRNREDYVTGVAVGLVPGVVAGWSALLERYGTITFGRALEPAIKYASEGFPVSLITYQWIANEVDRLGMDQNAKAVFLPHGQPVAAGSRLVQPQLATTLKTMADEGPRAFYEGSIAAAISKATGDADGVPISREDLAAYDVAWQEPATYDYRGFRIQTLPPPSAAIQFLETLGLLNGVPLREYGYNSFRHLHSLIEAIKLAREDRIGFRLGDSDADYRDLLSDDHLASVRRRLDPKQARATRGDWYTPDAVPQAMAEGGGEQTTHLVTADAEGNLVSLTQTLGWLFGGAAMLGNTGLLANCMLYWGFDFVEGGPYPVAAHKRPSTPMTPALITTARGEPLVAVGTPGGWGVPQTTVQTVSNVLDFSMNPQAAVEAPRLRVDEDKFVAIETRVPTGVIAGLRRAGHDCHEVGDWLYYIQPGRADLGRHAMAIVSAEERVLYTGADPRGDGYAAAE